MGCGHTSSPRSHPARIYPRVTTDFSQPSVLKAEVLSTLISTHHYATHRIATHRTTTRPIASHRIASLRCASLLLLLPNTTVRCTRFDSAASSTTKRTTACNCIWLHRTTQLLHEVPVPPLSEQGFHFACENCPRYRTAGYCRVLQGTPWECA